MNNNTNLTAENTSQGSLDSMARRYKDEMMRLYRMNGGSSAPPAGAVPSAPVAPSAPTSPIITQRTAETNGSCRFMTAEEIISGTPNDIAGIPAPLPAYSTATARSYGNDVTEGMINGSSASPYSLAAQGAVNNDSNSRNSSGEAIYVPNNPDGNSGSASAVASRASANNTSDSTSDNSSPFGGIIISPSVTGTVQNVASNILTELLPSFEFPPDIDENAAIPRSISPAYIILGSWFNLTGDNGWGFLQFEVTTGSLGNPVQNATVTVSRIINGNRLLTRILKTNASGVTKTIVLPAPRYYPIASPYVNNINRPFAEYRASVYANNYYAVTDISVLVEAGVKSVQPVDLVPLPDRPTAPGIQPRSGD